MMTADRRPGKELGGNQFFRPKFNKEIFPNAFIRKGVANWTLRTGEAGNAAHLHQHPQMWEPDDGGTPLVDEDWHAVCQAIYKGVEGAAWEKLCCKFVEMNKEVNVRSPGGSRGAKINWRTPKTEVTRIRIKRT